MSDKLETISDIIADHRQRAKEILGNGVYEDILEKEEAEDAALDHEEEADRIEAAYKRELGNAAAMREAVKAVVGVGYPHNFQHEAPHIRGYCYDITRAIAKCFAALSAPPRNCDVGTADEQAKRMDKFCNQHRHGFDGRCSYACENCKFISMERCELAWAQMPYEKEAQNEQAYTNQSTACIEVHHR